MIQITNDQIERVNLILSGIPGGAQKAFSSVIRRANSTVKAETVRQITGTYAISAQRVRAGGNIRAQVQKADGGVVGTVTFAGYKLPLYRFNVTPTLPIQRAEVKAAVMRGNGQTPFAHAFIARMKSGHTGMFERKTGRSLPITEFMAQSTAQMAGNEEVLEQVSEKAQETVNKRIEHEITRILNGYGV